MNIRKALRSLSMRLSPRVESSPPVVPSSRERFRVKRVGGAAAVAQLDHRGRVLSIDIHRRDEGGEPCEFLGGVGCDIFSSPVSSSVEDRVLSEEEFDRVLRRALRHELGARVHRSRSL